MYCITNYSESENVNIKQKKSTTKSFFHQLYRRKRHTSMISFHLSDPKGLGQVSYYHHLKSNLHPSLLNDIKRYPETTRPNFEIICRVNDPLALQKIWFFAENL